MGPTSQLAPWSRKSPPQRALGSLGVDTRSSSGATAPKFGERTEHLPFRSSLKLLGTGKRNAGTHPHNIHLRHL